MIHALGFTAGGFQFFKDENGKKYDQIVKIEERKFNSFTKKFVKFLLPNALKQARLHFNCPEIDGVYLENDGNEVGTVGSHWDQLYFYKELMVGNILSFPGWGLITDGRDQILSIITLGLLEDSGFYKVNFTNAEFLSWGYKFGCEIFNSRCENWKKENYFCNTPEKESCSSDYFQKSSCKIALYSNNLDFYQHLKEPNLGGLSVLDYCPFYFPQIQELSNCKLETNNNLTLHKNGQQFGGNSICFRSNLIKNGNYNPSNLRCFEINCTKIKDKMFKMFVKIENSNFECPDSQTINPVLEGYSGLIQCPDVNLACEIQISKVDYTLSQIHQPKKITSSSTKTNLCSYLLWIFISIIFH